MNWYVAKLVVEGRVGREPADLWDEQIIVIQARDPADAHAQAVQLGKKKAHSYKNAEDETVRWKFIGIGDLQHLDVKKISSGTEIISHLSRSERPRIPRKQDLFVFWFVRNKNRTVIDVLTEKPTEHAPAAKQK